MSADDAVILRPQGRFDFNGFRSFRASYESALAEEDIKCLVVDLQQVQYIDSAALGILLLLRDKATAQGVKVELANLQGTVKDVLEIANFHKIFSIR
ncbi:MAG: STAS domain-containing protein [Pseudomonas sp.]|nr:STAS domain-containing protein [Pseudomonas sp.]